MDRIRTVQILRSYDTKYRTNTKDLGPLRIYD